MLVFGHTPLGIDHLLQPTRHGVGQFQQVGERGGLHPHSLQSSAPPAAWGHDRGDVDGMELVLHPVPEILNRVEVGRGAGPVNDGKRLVGEVCVKNDKKC